MDDDESIRIARKKFREVKRQTKRVNTSNFKCEIPDILSSPLTEKQKKVIEKKMEGDFLGKFEVSMFGIHVVCHISVCVFYCEHHC